MKNIIERIGGPSAVARHLNIRSQAVSQWKQIPAEQVIPLYRALNGSVTPHEMRADLYPDPWYRPSPLEALPAEQPHAA